MLAHISGFLGCLWRTANYPFHVPSWPPPSLPQTVFLLTLHSVSLSLSSHVSGALCMALGALIFPNLPMSVYLRWDDNGLVPTESMQPCILSFMYWRLFGVLEVRVTHSKDKDLYFLCFCIIRVGFVNKQPVTMPKPLTVWITINCGKFWKCWGYQTTRPASWETYMQVRKQQLELDMGQQTGSKQEKEYIKAVYCHPA